MSEAKTKQKKKIDKQSDMPKLDRRALVGKLAKASVVVPVATLLFDASNNTANGY